MEKSNSFKRVLAGTLALLTVASSVPADAGSVIGDFFGSSLVAKAEADELGLDAGPKYAVTNFSGSTAKLSVDGAAAKDVSATVVADANNANIKTVTFAYTDSTKIGDVDADALEENEGVTVNGEEGYTVISAKITADGALEVKLNEFIARPTAGTTTYEFDGNAKDIKFGKRLGDTATNNNVEIAYRASATSSDYVVITDEDLRNPELFSWTKANDVANNKALSDTVSGKLVSITTDVTRDNNGNVTPAVIRLTGKAGTKYEGLVFDAPIKITPLDITNTVVVTPDLKDNTAIPHVTYDREAVVSADFLKQTFTDDILPVMTDSGVKVKLKINNVEEFDLLEEGAANDFTVSYAGRTDDELHQDGVLTDTDGDNVAESAVNVGLYTATLNFTGNYTGTAKQSFRILPAPLTVAQIKGLADAYTGSTAEIINKTVNSVANKIYNRKSECLVTKVDEENNPFGITLTTYKCEFDENGDPVTKINDNGTPDNEDDDFAEVVYSKTPTNDFSGYGWYKTVVTVSGNYKAETEDEAAIEWEVKKYDAQTDAGNRFVDDTKAWVGFAVNPSTGKIEAGFDVRDNIDTDLSAQAGVLLVNGTEYKVSYNIAGSKEAANNTYFDTIPTTYTKVIPTADPTDQTFDVTQNDKINVKFEFIGNYEGVVEVKNRPIEEYKLTPGATVLDKKVGSNEQVKYQYGDTITATVQDVPQVLTQESRYYPVNLNQNGAPTGADYTALTDLVKAVTDADATIATIEASIAAGEDTYDEDDLAAAIEDKQDAIDDLYEATYATPVAREKTEGSSYEDHGYVVVVFVNRNDDNIDIPDGDANVKGYAKNDGYKSFFDSAVGVSKGITVSKRTVDQNSTVEVEFVKSLLPYIGTSYTELQLMNNIAKVTVDGKVVYEKKANFANNAALKTAPFRLADIDNVTYKNVDSYSLKLTFDAVTAGADAATLNNEVYDGNDNYTGSYTTNISTQRFSIVAAQLTATDFYVNGKAIQAVYTKDGVEYVDGVTKVGADYAIVTTGGDTWKYASLPDADKSKFTFAYYQAVQTEADDDDDHDNNPRTDMTDGLKFVFDNKAWTIGVTPVIVYGAESAHYAYGAKDNATTGETMDFQVTGVTQTAAGEYELTIKGVKNTKGTVVVKWKIVGLDVAPFTVTPDKTNFDYNGEGQTPNFTVSYTDQATNVTTTLSEGKEYAVEYYTDEACTQKLETMPKNVGEYYAKIVGINSYYGSENATVTKFTIAPASTLDITIEDKAGADFSYNGEALIDRVDELFDIKVKGKALDEDAKDYTFHIVDEKATDASGQKNVGKYKIAVTVYDDNYQPKTSAQHDFEITPKKIILSNITASVTEAVYGAPVAKINDSITFDYDGVIDADKDKVSVKDFRGFVVVSDDYRAGSPAGQYGLVYNGDFVPESTAAKNYKAEKFTSDVKITIAKRDLADAKPFVSLVVVPSEFANTDPKVAGDNELKANQIVYNGKPYEVYIQKNDNGLMTMDDLKLTGTPKALHAASDLEVVAVASANGNYTGTATLNLAWAINQCEINHDVKVTITDSLGTATTTVNLPDSIGSDKDKSAKYHVATDVQFYMVDGDGNKLVDQTMVPNPDFDDDENESPENPKKIKGDNYGLYVDEDGALMPYASEAAGDYTVYFEQLDDYDKPIEGTRTTGYPTTGGKYRATVEFSKDFALVNTSSANGDPDFVPKRAEIGSVDFTVVGKPVAATIVDNNGDDFERTYGDSEEPSFTVTITGNTGDDLVTAEVDTAKMFKIDENGDYVLDDNEKKIPYDGTAGLYDLGNAIVMNNTDWSCDFTAQREQGGLTYKGGKLVYEVKKSNNYTIQFDHENNVFALSGGKAVAGYQVVDNNSNRVMKEDVDYTLKGSNEVYKTGTFTLFVEGIGNYCDDAHADWVVVNGDTSVDAKLLDSNTVSFKDQVQFNFLAEINDPEYVEGAYVIFTYDHYGVKTENKVPISKKDMYGKYYRFRQELTASEMAIPVKAELYLKNSAKPISTKTRSIKDYAETAIAKNLDGSNVLKAMLNYGGYTQVALGNNTSVLANESANIKEDVSAIQPKSATTFVRPKAYEGTTTVGATVGDIPQSVKIKFTPYVTYKGTTVMTKSKLYVRHYFIVDEANVDAEELAAIKVSVDKGLHYGRLIDLPKNSTGYYLDMPEEMAYNLDKAGTTVSVYDFPGVVTNVESYTEGGATVAAGAKTYKVGSKDLQGINGHDYAINNEYSVVGQNRVDIYAIEVVDYNVIDYCEAIANNAKQTTANKNMVKALYAYYQAANDYVAKRTKA